MSNTGRAPTGFIVGVIIFVALIVLFFAQPYTFTFIDVGWGGVKHDYWSGEVEDTTYSPGFYIYNGYTSDIEHYDCRMQEFTERVKVLSKNGLDIVVDLTTRYQLDRTKLSYFYREVGPDMEGIVTKFIKPQIRSSIRDVIGKYTEEELFSTKRGAVQTEIYARIDTAWKKYGINLDQVLLRDIILPEQIKDAIQQKLKHQQEALAYDYKLQREEKEAQRKLIEAQGIKRYNEELASGLTPQILRYRAIEVTEKLANSNNSKMIIIGGRDGLPIMLNQN